MLLSIPTAPTNLLLFSVTHRSFLSYPPARVRTDKEKAVQGHSHRPGILWNRRSWSCDGTSLEPSINTHVSEPRVDVFELASCIVRRRSIPSVGPPSK
jgi:hypothetical protein